MKIKRIFPVLFFIVLLSFMGPADCVSFWQDQADTKPYHRNIISPNRILEKDFENIPDSFFENTDPEERGGPIFNIHQWHRTQKLFANDGEANDLFSHSLAVCGNTAIIGAWGNDGWRGAAYIFEKNSDGTWAQVQKLLASDGVGGNYETADWFGSSVSISGNVAIVGSQRKNHSRGAAYVFVRNSNGTWPIHETQKLLSNDIWPYDRFGASVALSGNTAIIGAWGKDYHRGAAYIFQKNANGIWSQSQKIQANDGIDYDSFGASVAISGNSAIVGAWRKDSRRGAAYIFKSNASGNWEQAQKLLASDRANNDLFGDAVSIAGNTAVIGAKWKNNHAGAAYVFQQNSDGSWPEYETLKLLASNASDYDFFGASVSVSENHIIVGAPRKNTSKGAAYFFKKNSDGVWPQQETQELTLSDGFNDDLFGASVHISENIAMIGASGKNNSQGQAYIFRNAQNSSLPHEEMPLHY